MSDSNADSIVKAPAANDEVKAPGTTDGLPPITKEPAATAEASMVPLVPAGSTATDAPVALSSNTATKSEGPTAADAQEDSSNKLGEPDASNAQSEEPSAPSPAPAPESESAPTEAVASGIESSALTSSKDETVEPPKPVSVEETRDEDLPRENPVDSKKQAEEAPKIDVTGPVATTAVEATKAPVVDSVSAENGVTAPNNKRKADTVEDAAEPEANNIKNGHPAPPEKKLKTNGAGTNGAPRKPGRPRKDKKAVPAVGRTARKTRSQGTAD